MILRAGEVLHYFDTIKVVSVELVSDLAIGEQVRFLNNGTIMFDQQVTSLQSEHKQIVSAQKGSIVALGVVKEVPRGAQVYKVIS